MRKIILTSLFFCLAITTVLAQVVTTNIATPVAGFSNNSVADFDVNSDGTILNNSATNGTATLGSTAVTANPNITAGSEADLILLQVTGTNGSDLDGAIEVFGTEAGIIIANPNGITCDGCGFINTNRVDLVTGTLYDALTDRFGNIAAADIDISSSGLTVDVLNIQTGADFNNAGAINADTVTIEVTNFDNDIANTGTVLSDSLNFILTDDFTRSSTSFNGFTFNNLGIDTDGLFHNEADLTVNNFNVETGTSFYNSSNATINANTFNVATRYDFYNYEGAIINADNFNVTTVYSFLNEENSTINANNFNVISGIDFINRKSTINANNFNVTAGYDFYNTHSATIDADTVTTLKLFALIVDFH